MNTCAQCKESFCESFNIVKKAYEDNQEEVFLGFCGIPCFSAFKKRKDNQTIIPEIKWTTMR